MWGRVAVLVFGMTHGVGLLLWRNSFLLCMLALYLKKHGSLTWLYLLQKEVGAGICCSIMVLRIGRLPLSIPFLSLFIPLCRGVRGMISWSGDWLSLVFLMCALFISYYLVLTLMPFLGSVFGILRCLNECLSFLWRAANDGILTSDNLIKKCQFLPNRCCLCCCDGESMDHLLLHCKFSHALWCKVFAMFGIQWVMPRLVSSFFFKWRNWFGKHLSTIWNMVPTCLMWLV